MGTNTSWANNGNGFTATAFWGSEADQWSNVYGYNPIGSTIGYDGTFTYGRRNSPSRAGILNPDGSQTGGAKALRMLASFIATDSNKTFFGKVLQILGHFTWELPQQVLGLLTGEFTNLFGGIESVYRYTNGAMVLSNRWMSKGEGFTLGNIITVGKESSISDIQHEFGHYIQSRIFGPLWTPAFGIPSIINAWLSPGYPTLQEYENSFYTEKNAGILGRKYW